MVDETLNELQDIAGWIEEQISGATNRKSYMEVRAYKHVLGYIKERMEIYVD
jgi:hypothetical protein